MLTIIIGKEENRSRKKKKSWMVVQEIPLCRDYCKFQTYFACFFSDTRGSPFLCKYILKFSCKIRVLTLAGFDKSWIAHKIFIEFAYIHRSSQSFFLFVEHFIYQKGIVSRSWLCNKLLDLYFFRLFILHFFIEYWKAFDRANRKKLVEILSKRGYPQHLIGVVQSMYV